MNIYIVFLSLEQQYVGLVPIRRGDDSMQSKVYAFYKEKNKDTGFYSEMWLPYVTRVCMVRPT